MWYNWTMNNTSPKGRVTQLALHCAGEGATVVVLGERLKRRGGGPKPPFYASVLVNGTRVASATHRDWRKAYKGLEIELSKMGIL